MIGDLGVLMTTRAHALPGVGPDQRSTGRSGCRSSRALSRGAAVDEAEQRQIGAHGHRRLGAELHARQPGREGLRVV